MPDIKVMGSIGVRRRGVHITPSSRMTRGLLAMLAADANRRIGSSTLCEALWDDPPRSAQPNLRSYVSQLRTLLRDHDCAIVTHQGSPGAYSLRIASDQLDLSRFRNLAERARRASRDRPEQAMDSYESALNLWRGDHDGMLPDTVTMRTLSTGWELEYGRALERYADLAIANGRTGTLITHLYAHTWRHPDRPGAVSLLKAAIAGRADAALADLPADVAMDVYAAGALT